MPPTPPNSPSKALGSISATQSALASQPAQSAASASPAVSSASARPASPTSSSRALPSNLSQKHPDFPHAAVAAAKTGSPKKVHEFKDCWFRCQNPLDTERGGNPDKPLDSRVTETHFHATERMVDKTLNDFGDGEKTNLKLWLKGSGSTLQYVGIQTGLPITLSSQNGLANDMAIFTILLPDSQEGHKLQKITPSHDAEMRHKLEVTLAGLNGVVDPKNRVYCYFRDVQIAVTKRTSLEFLGLDNHFFLIDFSRL